MALTRPKLKEILSEAEANEEKIAQAVDKIISGHTATTDALKEERDSFKADAEKLPKVEKELEALKAKGDDGYKAKYEAEHKALEELKADIEAKETYGKQEKAFIEVAKEGNFNPERFKTMKNAEKEFIKSIELDENGKAKDVEAIKTRLNDSYPDFILNTEVKGANTATPPANNGKSTMTKEQIYAIKDTVERQKAMAENKELFL